MSAGGSDGLWPDAASLVDEMERTVRGESPIGQPALGGLVAELVRSNLEQWDLEDVSRDPEATDAAVADAKRMIDRLNLSRHHIVQNIDVAVAGRLALVADAPLATESPGMVIDRLSVLVIRRARTALASSLDGTYAERLPAVDAQIGGLSNAMDTYLDELQAGTRRFLAHDHLKLYGGGADSSVLADPKA